MRHCFAIGVLAVAGPVHAAPIIFGEPVTMAEDTDVMNIGALAYGFSESNLPATVNGVPFAAGNSVSSLGGGSITMSGFNFVTNGAYGTVAEAPFNSLSAGYKDLIKGAAWRSSANGTATITLNNLTAGRSYAPQLWFFDSRSFGFGRNASVMGANTVTPDYNTTDAVGGVGQYTKGWFIASGASQSFMTTSGTSNQLNAIQLRDVTGIGSWTGEGGAVWDQNATANFTTNGDTALLATGTFSALRDSLGAVVFGDTYSVSGAPVAVANNDITIAPGGVSGAIVLFRNTAALPYTVTSSDALGIRGAASVWVDGGGSVTLAGDHSYTGATGIRNGSLTLTKIPGSGSIANAGTLTLDSTLDQVYSGIISGTGVLVKAGTGTLTLTGANSYTGATTISAGKLRIGDGTSGSFTASAGNVSVAAGATVEFGPSAIAIAENKTFSGAGAVVFAGSNNGQPTGEVSSFQLYPSSIGFSGTMTADNARVMLGDSASGGTKTLMTRGNGQFYVFGSPFSNNFVIQGNGWGGDGGVLGAIRLSGTLTGTITMSGDSRIGIDITGRMNGDISESGGARTLELIAVRSSMSARFGGANTYTGNTIFDAGTNSGQLTLGYTTNNGSKLSDTGSLILRSNMSLALEGGSHAEVVGSTVIGPGLKVRVDRYSGASTINLGAITHGIGTTLSVDQGSVVKTSNVPVSGNLGGWLTIGESLLATTDSSGFIVPVSYTDVPLNGAIADGMDQVRISDYLEGSVVLGAGAVINVNSITRSKPSSGGLGRVTVDMAGKTLRLGASGVVLSETDSAGITFGTTVDSGVLTAGGTGNAPGALYFSTLGGNVVVNATITDNGSGVVSVSKTGDGVLGLFGTNTYSGGTMVRGGSVWVNSDSAFGSGAVAVIGSTTFAGMSGGQPVTTIDNALEVGSTATLTLSTEFTNFDINNAITGAGGLGTAGTGICVLNGVNPYTGSTLVKGGLLRIAPDASISATSSVAIDNGANSGITNYGTLTTAGVVTINAGYVSSGSVFTNGDAAGITPGRLKATGLTLKGDSNSGSFDGRGGVYLQNPGSITDLGAGTLTVNGSGAGSSDRTVSGSTFTNGGGSVTAGTLSLATNFSGSPHIGASYIQTAGSTTITGAVVFVAGSVIPGSVGNDSSLTLTGGTFSASRLGLSGTTTVSGAAVLTATGAISIGGEGDFNAPGKVNQTGGTVTFTTEALESVNIGNRNGTSTYVLSGGTWNVPGCVTQVGHFGDGVLNVSGGTANLKGIQVGFSSFPGTLTATGGRLNLGNAGLGINGIGKKTLTLGNTTLGASADWTGSAKITLSDSTVGTVFDTLDCVDGVTPRAINFTGVISGTGKLVKSGAGTLTLSGANTHTGGIDVNAGMLKLTNTSGSATGSGAVTVASSCTLAGNGAASGAVSVAGGATISPGDANPGTLKTGPLALAGMYSCGVQGAASDLIAVTGDLNLSGPLAISAMNPSGNLIIATYTGTRSGDFTSVAGLPAGYALSYNDVAKRVELTISDAYLAWTSFRGVAPGLSARELNPDDDSLNNLGEFAFDGNPNSAAGDGKIVSKVAKLSGEDVFTLTVPVRAGASFSPSGPRLTATVGTITYQIEGGIDLDGFTQPVEEVVGTPATDLQSSLALPGLSVGWIYHTFRFAPAGTPASKGFLRARVTE